MNTGSKSFMKQGWAVGKEVKMPAEIPASHSNVSVFLFRLHSWFQLPANMHHESKWNMTAVVRFLSSTWESWIEFLTFRHLGYKPEDGRDTLLLCLQF